MTGVQTCALPISAKVAKRFGRGVLDAEGRVDRKALGAAAFRSKKGIRDLERLLHPAVIAATDKRIAQLRRAKGAHVVVIDAPLLFEAKMHRMCNAVVFVDAPKAVRLKRVKASRGWTRAELETRERRQKSLEYKRRNADIVIRNATTRRAMAAQARECWRRVQACLNA